VVAPATQAAQPPSATVCDSRFAFANDGSPFHIKRRKQRCRSMPHVVMRATFDLAGPARQQRLREPLHEFLAKRWRHVRRWQHRPHPGSNLFVEPTRRSENNPRPLGQRLRCSMLRVNPINSPLSASSSMIGSARPSAILALHENVTDLSITELARALVLLPNDISNHSKRWCARRRPPALSHLLESVCQPEQVGLVIGRSDHFDADRDPSC